MFLITKETYQFIININDENPPSYDLALAVKLLKQIFAPDNIELVNKHNAEFTFHQTVKFEQNLIETMDIYSNSLTTTLWVEKSIHAYLMDLPFYTQNHIALNLHHHNYDYQISTAKYQYTQELDSTHTKFLRLNIAIGDELLMRVYLLDYQVKNLAKSLNLDNISMDNYEGLIVAFAQQLSERELNIRIIDHGISRLAPQKYNNFVLNCLTTNLSLEGLINNNDLFMLKTLIVDFTPPLKQNISMYQHKIKLPINLFELKLNYAQITQLQEGDIILSGLNYEYLHNYFLTLNGAKIALSQHNNDLYALGAQYE